MGVGVSAVDPIGPALNRTGRTLFKPFNATKWATLGFCAFLATLGEGGSFSCQSFGGPGPIPGSGAHSLPEFLDEIWKAFLNNAHWVIPVAAVSLMIAVAMLWLRARGKFMLLEGIVQDRGDVVEPWKRWRAEANSYFRFELLLHVLVMLGGVSVVALGYVVALPDIRANRFGAAAIAVIIVGVLLLAGLGFLFAIIRALAEDFLIPIMYLRNQPIAPAWLEFRRAVLPGNFWSIVLFYVMRLVLGLGAAGIIFVGMCATCFVAALPYVSAVVFLPIFVFNRTYSLAFLRQVGHDYNLMSEPVRVIGFPVIMAPMAPPPLPIAPPDMPPPAPGDQPT